MDNPNKLKDKVVSLPDKPGVYMFKDAQGKIIYIGKAKSLKKRVGSYFIRAFSAKTQALVSKIADMEYIVTPSEAKSLLLEANLIKEKQPYYNISLKDDKSFPFIKISDDEFPIVCVCRQKKFAPEDKSSYFGPYTDPKLLRRAIKVMRRIFGFRSCKVMPGESCLYGRLKLCPEPCIGRITKQEYRELIKRIKLFLESKYEELLDRLNLEMKELAKEKKFEDAAKIRDQINALAVFDTYGKYDPLTLILSPKGRGKGEGYNELEDLKDLLGLDRLPQRIEAFDISNIQGKEATGAMVSFYNGRPDKNNYRRFRIRIAAEPNDYAMLKEVVSRRYKRLKEENAVMPDLILIDGGNAHLNIARAEIEKLGLNIPLMSIAKPRCRFPTLRLRHSSRSRSGQIAHRGRDQENIYVYSKDKPISFKSDTPALNLIRRVRDEAHRFAVKYHHLLHKKKILGK